MGQEAIVCQTVFDKPIAITYPVVECNEYRDSTLPSLTDMTKIAWIVNADRKTGRVGFMSGAKMDDKARETVIDEAREGSPFRR